MKVLKILGLAYLACFLLFMTFGGTRSNVDQDTSLVNGAAMPISLGLSALSADGAEGLEERLDNLKPARRADFSLKAFAHHKLTIESGACSYVYRLPPPKLGGPPEYLGLQLGGDHVIYRRMKHANVLDFWAGVQRLDKLRVAQPAGWPIAPISTTCR